MSLTLTFEITFASDYHVGAGYGKGFGLDSALLREADGKPVLRGSALAGLLRGSAYRLLESPPLQKHPRDKTVQRLFGHPGQAKRWHVASAHPVERRPQDALAVRRVRIDPRTRRAEPHKLFSQEEGLAGQVFGFTITCPQSDETALDEAALLVAAARFTRQLGRSRRRGLGECVVHLTDVAGVDAEKPAEQSWEEWFLERFDQKWLQGDPAEALTVTPKADVEAIATWSGAPVRLRVILRLDEPLIIAERAPAGNQFDARPVIPGWALLGALANPAAQRCDLSQSDEYRDFVALFLRGGVAFPALYPAYHYSNNLYPAIPAPLGLLTCSIVPFEGESEGHGVFPATERKECPECQNRLEPVGRFVTLRRQEPFTYTPRRSSELHIKVQEKNQRVEKGQLYGYTVLDAGQYFVGELVCAGEDAWKRLQEMTGVAEKTPLTWRIGKARRRGYGQVTAWLERCDNQPQTWVQLPLEERVKDPTQPFTLTLLSDSIIVDPWGRQATGFTKTWLEPVLGLGPVAVVDAYARTRIVDSFNATWGLPRRRDMALVAGSVAWVRLSDPPAGWQERIAQLEAEGIGLRRNEGYGRMVFNHPIYDQREKLTGSAIRLEEPMRPGDGAVRDSFMKRWEEELDRHRPVLLKIKQERRKQFDNTFGALARWLYVQSNEPPQTLHDKLAALTTPENAFGQPDKGLIETIGQDEYGDRSEDNFFAQDGTNGVQAIRQALNDLNKTDPQYWPHGIARLADWLAALAADKKGGAQ